MKNKKILLGSLFLLLIISTVLFKINSTSGEKLEKITMQGDFAMDITKVEEVVGNSENVFIAKVIKEVGSDKDLPSTQFQVEVEKNIKGKLKKDQVISQNAGVFERNGEEFILVYEGQELLVPGKTYLFASIYERNNNWHNTVPAYGEILLDDDKKKSEIVIEYTEAFKNQKISSFMKRHKELDLENGFIEE